MEPDYDVMQKDIMDVIDYAENQYRGVTQGSQSHEFAKEQVAKYIANMLSNAGVSVEVVLTPEEKTEARMSKIEDNLEEILSKLR